MEQFEPAADAVDISEDFAHEIAETLNEGQRRAQFAIKREMAGYDGALRGLEDQEDRTCVDDTRSIPRQGRLSPADPEDPG